MSEPRPWQVLTSETLLDYTPWLKVIRQAVQLPGGVRIEDYLLAPSRDYSMVVALTEASEVVLVRQYKHGLGRVILDFPAGYLDALDEDPLVCAQRELREETGYAAQAWTALGAWSLDSNRMPNVAHLYFACGLQRVTDPHLDATEALDVLTVPARRIPEMLRAGDMPTLACAAAWGLASPHIFK